jgi:hypothetical protein
MQHNLPHQARAGPRGEARDGDTPAGHALELPASEIPALEVRTIAGVDYRRAAPAPSRGVQTNIASHDHPRDTCQRLLNWTGPSALAAPGLSIAAPSTVLTTTRARPTLPINRNSCIVSSVFSFSVTSTTTHGAVVPIPPLPATNLAPQSIEHTFEVYSSHSAAGTAEIQAVDKVPTVDKSSRKPAGSLTTWITRPHSSRRIVLFRI